MLLASATNQGKFLARFDAPAGPGRLAGRIDELDERYCDDPVQTANLRRFYDELERRDVSATETAYAPNLPDDLPRGFAVAGTDRCRECHAVDYRSWSKSRHARAWNSLTPTRAHTNPACQRCHTTGYGMPGGFASLDRSPWRRGVGCESCHGPSLAHADDPAERTAYFAQAASHCVVCHDRENSPDFDYETYWNRIRHGETPATAPRPDPTKTIVFAGYGGLSQLSGHGAETSNESLDMPRQWHCLLRRGREVEP
ncbi:MAG: cytochrome c family protein [Pirellulaceae bacterium]